MFLYQKKKNSAPNHLKHRKKSISGGAPKSRRGGGGGACEALRASKPNNFKNQASEMHYLFDVSIHTGTIFKNLNPI